MILEEDLFRFEVNRQTNIHCLSLLLQKLHPLNSQTCISKPATLTPKLPRFLTPPLSPDLWLAGILLLLYVVCCMHTSIFSVLTDQTASEWGTLTTPLNEVIKQLSLRYLKFWLLVPSVCLLLEQKGGGASEIRL